MYNEMLKKLISNRFYKNVETVNNILTVFCMTEVITTDEFTDLKLLVEEMYK